MGYYVLHGEPVFGESFFARYLATGRAEEILIALKQPSLKTTQGYFNDRGNDVLNHYEKKTALNRWLYFLDQKNPSDVKIWVSSGPYHYVGTWSAAEYTLINPVGNFSSARAAWNDYVLKVKRIREPQPIPIVVEHEFLSGIFCDSAYGRHYNISANDSWNDFASRNDASYELYVCDIASK